MKPVACLTAGPARQQTTQPTKRMNFFSPIEQRSTPDIIRFKPGETARVPVTQLGSVLLRVGPLAIHQIRVLMMDRVLGGHKALASCILSNDGRNDLAYSIYLVACDRFGELLACFSLTPTLYLHEADGPELLVSYGMLQPDYQSSIDHLLVKAVIHQLDDETIHLDPR